MQARTAFAGRNRHHPGGIVTTRAESSPPGRNRHHLGEIIATRARSGQAGVHERPDRWITSAQRTPATPPPTGPPDRRLGTSWYGPERSSPGRDRRHMRVVTTGGIAVTWEASPSGRERHQPGGSVTSRAKSSPAERDRARRAFTSARMAGSRPLGGRRPRLRRSVTRPTGLHHPRRLDDPLRGCLAEAAQLSALIFPRRMRSCFSASSSSTAASSSVRRSFT